jgi:hypothetical protein
MKIALNGDGRITEEARPLAEGEQSRRKAASLLMAMGDEGMSIFEMFDINME